MSRTVAILGAGPIGLAAAHGALMRGYVPVVLERDTPGASLARYGATKLFSPMRMNLPPALLALATPAVAPDAILSGVEFARVVASIAAAPILAKHVLCNHRVLAVTRDRFSRGEQAGHPVRAEMPFRVVARVVAHAHDTAEKGVGGGLDRAFDADAVLDATGVYDSPVPIIAPGAALLAGAVRDLGAFHARLHEHQGRRILLVGHGHSAANAIVALARLAEEFPTTHVTWALRTRNLRPFATVPSDPLPERERVVSRANHIAFAPAAHPWLRVERAASVIAFACSASSREPSAPAPSVHVSFSGNRTAEVDVAIWLTGQRPDLSFLSELPLEISPATEGARRLSDALANVTDCLSVPTVTPDDLASGEPRFHLIGAKSYGRARTFLLQAGYAQVETILDHLF